MLKFYILLLFTFNSIILLAQSDYRYYAKNWKEVSKDSAYYKKEICISTCSCKTYYITGEIYKEEMLENWKPYGISTIYYKNGKINSKTQYADGVKNGDFISWYANGLMKEKGKYINEEYTINEFWDSTGTSVVKDGNGTYMNYFENGILESKGEFKHGRKKGEWYYWYFNGRQLEISNYKDNKKSGTSKGWYMNGQPYYIEKYFNGELTKGDSYSKDGIPTHYTQLTTEVSYPGGYEAFNKDIQKELGDIKPYIKVHAIYRIFIDMVVDTTGKITQPIINNGISPAFDELMIRSLPKTKLWIPATYRGQKVIRRIRIPFVIK